MPPRLQSLRTVRWRAATVSLPHLIHDCLTATEAYDGDEGRRAHTMTAYAHQLAALFLTKLSEGDLAWTAASRGLAAANASQDHVVIGSLSRSAAHSLAAIGEYAQARGLAATAAQFLEPRLGKPTPQLLSVYGSLHLVCALAAARNDDRASADTHIAEADAAAQRLGADGNHLWTAFGPTNVSIHKTTIAIELGDAQRAIAIGAPLDTSTVPVERQVRHAIETARALARWNRIDDALATLLDAEVIGPDQVRYHRLSRDLVRDILTRPRPPRLAVELSDRMGVRPEGPRW
ncbi:XRE family transcriptional regulator [Salinispora arenicola]|uniref:XRE family transcriptional regulator n=1 Tax=Salinispora arenicola TaxID=168697 RepID=UPI001E51FCAB|nr:XRE family transcriptional regulator [Salinispora arenicola]